MPEKIPEPTNTRSFGIAFALSQLGEQPALAGLGTLGVEIKRLIAESREIVLTGERSMTLTNEETNVKAQELADRVKAAAAAGETPDDLQRLVFMNVKALIVELTTNEAP